MIKVGAVVGRGFVSVNNELWLFIGVDLRAGKFLGVDDPSGKQSCDCLLLEIDSSYVFFFFQIRSSTARSRPARGSTPRQSQGSSSTPTNPLPTTVPTVTMTGPPLEKN